LPVRRVAIRDQGLRKEGFRLSVYFDRFRKSFRKVHSAGRKLVLGSLSAKDRHLRRLMSFVLAYQKPSDYVHVFKYAYCRSERDFPGIVKPASCIHLLQASSFLTDDIFDFATTRYGHPAVHKTFGVTNAIVATELLQSVAGETLSAELARGSFHNECRVLEIFNRMIRELYVGQYLDVFNTGNLRMDKREYFRVIALAVGNFMAHTARMGALLAGRPDAEVHNLTGFGYHYGMALFITDDMVDVIDQTDVTGKSYAADLKNRRMRLPVILALERGKAREVRFLKKVLRKRRLSREEMEKARQIIRDSRALDGCLRTARWHLARSEHALSKMQESPTTRNLRWLAETLLTAQRLASPQTSPGK
jgi:geranylgeranyl pyrophosphate synthase